jgi:2-phosphosulfolactate phosphatase
MPKIDLYPLAKDAPPEAPADATVIVVDLLRASTTIATALAAGAECVMPFAEIDDTLAAAQAYGRQNVLLGGERGGRLIPGFDLGNSPSEYTPERVAGRRILFTTTNGARALHHAWNARRVLVGSLANRTAVARMAAKASRCVVLCAGTDGYPALEDIYAGGLIIERILAASGPWTLNDEAQAALQGCELCVLDPDAPTATDIGTLVEIFRAVPGGRNLIDIGQEADLARCAEIDALTVVPQLDPATGELRPA